jgi:hypothetical protein
VREPKIQEVDDIEAVPVEEHNVIFKPNAGPQTEFLAAGEREVLYGGSAGGGKSYAMLADPFSSFRTKDAVGSTVRCKVMDVILRP